MLMYFKWVHFKVEKYDIWTIINFFENYVVLKNEN